MDDKVVTTEDLLTAWREAVRAAELAERLAAIAADTAEQADARSVVAEEIAQLADRAAGAASSAAARARSAADQAAELAKSLRETGTRDAQQTLAASKAVEGGARDAYRHAEAEAATRQARDGS